MHIRPLFYLIIILMGYSVSRSVVAKDASYVEPEVEELISDDEQTIERDSLSKRLPEGIISTKVVDKQTGRSIKMIVGGQSTDGLAKQVTLPVED